MLELKNLKKSFYTPSPIEILKNINMSISKGEWASLMGPSGSGKSTLLSIIAALDTATSGKITIDGENISELDEKQRALFRATKLGFIFQSFRLIPHLDIVENVSIPTRILERNPKESREKARSLLKQVGLGDRLNHKPSQLSGGEQQRVAIARAFINEPTLLLADEPTGNLDEDNSLVILDMLKELKEKSGSTMLVVSHDPNVAKRADLQFRLTRGELEKVAI